MAPIIIGRPFLVTAEAKIYVNKGELTMEIDGENVMFNVSKEADNSFHEKVHEAESTITYEPP